MTTQSENQTGTLSTPLVPYTSVPYKERMYSLLTLADVERFWTRVRPCAHGEICQECCWEWPSTGRGGYARFSVQRALKYRLPDAHRLMYLFTRGDIPQGLCVLHHCDNRRCVNPAHLWLGTKGDNNTDRSRKGRTAMGDANGSRLHPERMRRGEQHGNAKLTEQEVQQILHSRGVFSQRVLARKFGVSKRLVQFIHQRKLWQHLPEETDDGD